MSPKRTPAVLTVGDRPWTLEELRSAWRGPVRVVLGPGCLERLERSRRTITEVLEHGDTVYGVNTGFGLLAHTRIDADQLEELQRNLVLSHSVGVGPNLDDAVVRLLIVLKIAGLCRGHSGVRPQLVQALCHLLLLLRK